MVRMGGVGRNNTGTVSISRARVTVTTAVNHDHVRLTLLLGPFSPRPLTFFSCLVAFSSFPNPL